MIDEIREILINDIAECIDCFFLNPFSYIESTKCGWKEEGEYTVVIFQVDGKLIGKEVIYKDEDKGAIERLAMNNSAVIKYIGDKNIEKIVLIPKKLVNIITK